jgi:glutamate N-acetyltransferase / amino-acid N-acetyltransferase
VDSAERVRSVVDGGVTLAAGFSAGAVYAGIKTPGHDKYDLAIVASDRPCVAAAVFTQNAFAAAPVLVSREHLAGGAGVRGIVVNAGNANACTGAQGLADAREMCALAAARLHAAPEQILVASTGVIGVPMPMELIRQAVGEIELNPEGARRVPRAIMTTDTRPKIAGVEFEVGGRTVRMGGIAKGAAMIHPNMATMLCFVTTDAAVEPGFLQEALRAAVADSFNMISVDGDTSTNDTVLALANGSAGNETIGGGEDGEIFVEALTRVCSELAQAIVGDAEGGTKVIRMVVKGARSREDARAAARAVVSSNLTKAAVYGADPNWGRVLCAVGYSGAHVDPEAVDLWVGDVQLVRAGAPVEGSREAAAPAMAERVVAFTADLHVGDATATAWGSDLTEQYVVENSAYTT